LDFFWDRVSQTIYPGWLGTMILWSLSPEFLGLLEWATGAWLRARFWWSLNFILGLGENCWRVEPGVTWLDLGEWILDKGPHWKGEIWFR
jgi:hypothetical protein